LLTVTSPGPSFLLPCHFPPSSGPAGAGVQHRCRTTLVHPPSTQRAVARRHGGGCSIVRCSLQLWRGLCGDLELFLVVVGPLCLFLIVVGACHHPLTLPNLQAGACSGGNGWWVGIVTLGEGGGVECVSVTWHAYGGCYVTGGTADTYLAKPQDC
jgi:hypothetical protein